MESIKQALNIANTILRESPKLEIAVSFVQERNIMMCRLVQGFFGVQCYGFDNTRFGYSRLPRLLQTLLKQTEPFIMVCYTPTEDNLKVRYHNGQVDAEPITEVRGYYVYAHAIERIPSTRLFVIMSSRQNKEGKDEFLMPSTFVYPDD